MRRPRPKPGDLQSDGYIQQAPARESISLGSAFFGFLAIFGVLIGLWQIRCDILPSYFTACTTVIGVTVRPAGETKDPLELITRRGYKPDERSLKRAIELKRLEDVRLLLASGARFRKHPIMLTHLDGDTWDLISKHDGLPPVNCQFERPQRSDRLLLDGAIKNNNHDAYKLLCGGKYVKSIKQKAARTLATFNQRSDAERRRFDREVQALSSLKMKCIKQLTNILSVDVLKENARCEALSRKQGGWPGDCRRTIEGTEAKVDKIANEMVLAGFVSDRRTPGNVYSRTERSGKLEVWHSSWRQFVGIRSQMSFDYEVSIVDGRRTMSEFLSLRKKAFKEACHRWEPKPPQIIKNDDVRFYERFLSAFG